MSVAHWKQPKNVENNEESNEQARIDIAPTLLAQGLEVAQVAAITGLPGDTIARLEQ